MQAAGSDRPKPSKILSILLWLAIAQGSLTHIVTAMQFNPIHYPYMTDPYRHWLFAQQTLYSHPMAAIDPLLYQVWLSAVAKVTAGDPVAIGFYSGILSALNPYCWYLFLKEALDDEIMARTGWALLLWLPSWLGIYSYFMPETLLLPLLGLALWLTWRSKRVQSVGSFVGCTFAWLLACLTRAVALPMAVMSAFWLLKGDSQFKKKRLLLILITVPMLLVPAYRSYKLLGVWSPFGYPLMNQIYMVSGAKEFHVEFVRDPARGAVELNYQSPSLTENPLEPLSNWHSSREGKLSYRIFLDHGADDWMEVLAQNKHDWVFQSKMMLENAVYFLFGRSWPDYDDQHDRLWESLQVQMRWMWAPLLLIAAAGNLFIFVRRKALPFLPVLVMVSWILGLTVCMGVNEGRYRKPIEGLLIANILWLAQQTLRRRPPEAAAISGEASDAAQESTTTS